MEFHHIGIATKNIEELLEKLKGILDIKEISPIFYYKLQDANLCMVTLNDGVKLELISGNQVANLVKKRNYLYHTCFKVKSIEEELDKRSYII